MPSSTVENYLKQILSISLDRDNREVAMGLISEALGVTPGTATSMVKNLEKEGWLTYKSRKGVKLTASGRKLGMNILRRHRLLETFLVETLGLDWSEIHDEAEELEHAISEKVLERLDEFLGRPRHDPHGHPIPTKGGIIQKHISRSLLDCKEGMSVTIDSIDDQEKNFLKFARSRHVVPGNRIRILSHEEVANAMELRIDGKPSFSIGFEAARKILVSD
jgi:DtxR family Mn-dependent transcriptional regulator